jgi:transposase
MVLWKRLEQGAFQWPPISDGVIRLSESQLAALVDGIDWSRLMGRMLHLNLPPTRWGKKTATACAKLSMI